MTRPLGPPGFRDLGALGRGGMAEVRRVYDERLEREVAVKRLDDANDPESARVRRFVQEARVTGQLEHPNIVPVHELGLDAEGRVFLVMKLVRGQTLLALVEEAGAGRLAPRQLGQFLEILLRICDAVAFAHSRGIVHRDLKPANIMVGEFGQVYVMDWGIAKVEGDDPVPDPTGQVLGTPAWLAPEQAEGMHHRADARTDVFALGALLYFVLGGRGPYAGVPPESLLFHAATARIVPLAPEDEAQVPPALLRIARRALARRPADRYASALAFRTALDDFVRGVTNLREVRFAAGTVFVREGEPGETAWIVQDGRCAVFTEVGGERRVLRELGPGDVLGEASIFARAPRSASVTALTDLVMLEIDRAVLENALGLNQWMGIFVRTLAERFLDLDRRRRG